MITTYTFDQKWPGKESWERADCTYKNLKSLNKELKEIKGYDKYENRNVEYRLIKITEKIIK